MIFAAGMKRICTYTAVFFLAAILLYGGAGLNVIHFCCDGCRISGTPLMTAKADVCAEDSHLHSHDCCGHETNCCDSEAAVADDATVAGDATAAGVIACCSHNDHSGADCCSFERISFDLFSQHAPKLISDPSSLCIDLFTCDLYRSSFLSCNSCEVINDLPNGPPLPAPRDYLSLLSILLI